MVLGYKARTWFRGILTPALSPRRGRSNLPRRFTFGLGNVAALLCTRGKTNRKSEAIRILDALPSILPLPGGEGRGEGERQTKIFTFVLSVIAAIPLSASAASLPTDWQLEQHFSVPAPGLVKLNLPVETLDAARPALEDLRLYDAAGNELPFAIERPVPASKISPSAKSFSLALNPTATIITLETGLTQPLDGVALETPSPSFLKPVNVEGSTDGQRWRTLTQGQPIFRQSSGASQLRLTFPTGAWAWLRLTVDDQRSQPIPFTGARVHAAAAESTPSEPVPATIAERQENPGETRLTLNLGAANLDLAALHFETAEPLFTRSVTLAVPQVLEDSIHEQTIAQSVIYRVADDGQSPSTNLSVSLETQVRSRELLVFIRNQDSPPLPITAVRAERRPVYLLFMAHAPGMHHLLAGNNLCPAPRYDLAALGASLKTTAVSPIKLSPLADNPNYRRPEVLPGLDAEGTALDVSDWKFRKEVRLARAGAQQLELDLQVLAHAQPGFADLRLVRAGRQVPYIIERTSIRRALTPMVTATNDAKDKTLSRWMLELPEKRLPVTRLTCATRSPLFQRNVTLYEVATDERGEKYRRPLTSAAWTQTPEHANQEFTLTFDGPLQSDTLFLETPNGDNPPIVLDKFQVSYSATRVLFKGKPDDALYLYYGNPHAASPRYDLSLVAGKLLAAEKFPGALANAEQLKKSSWADGGTPGKGGFVLWGILGVVVVGLLIVISRLLPKTPAS